MPDEWEIARGFDPAAAADGAADPDGDGLSNAEEYTGASDPRRSDSDGDGFDDVEERHFATIATDPASFPTAGTFSDVPVTQWAWHEIEACCRSGIVTGYGDGSYRPEVVVTRDQMAVYVARALAGGDESVPDFTGDPSFLDVTAMHWALDYVEYAVANGVVYGYDGQHYRPENEVTRDQMAVYMARSLLAPLGDLGLIDYVPADPRNFPDVASDFWAYTHIEYCVENGVVAGYADGFYRPTTIVTRDQLAVYVARAFGLVS
jgi:hypothetical protein